MRDITDAHYLHVRQGLEAVLRPPVQHPTAMVWLPGREELLVADRQGALQTVDPVMGTRTLATDVGEAAVLEVSHDGSRWALLGRGGHWRVGQLGGELLHSGRHHFLGGMSAFFWKKYLVLVGDEVEGRRMLIVEGDQVRARPRLPPRVIPMVSAKDELCLGRSTAAGLQVIRYGKGARFEAQPATAHRLRVSGGRVLGLTPTGAAVWDLDGGNTRSIRLPELTAGAVFRDGVLMALGTRTGAVALARLGVRTRGVRPDLVKAFDAPVVSVCFSKRGRWLATGAEGLQLWSWEV